MVIDGIIHIGMKQIRTAFSEKEKFMQNDRIILRCATKADVPKIQSWLDLDSVNENWLKSISGEEMVEYYCNEEQCNEEHRIYIVVIAGVEAGIITIELEDENMKRIFAIDHFLIRQDFRRRGYGQQALKLLLEKKDLPQDVPVQTEINGNNLASIRCFSAVGFIRMQNSSHIYEYRR